MKAVLVPLSPRAGPRSASSVVSQFEFSGSWVRIHKTTKLTPAMAAGLTDKLMGWPDIVALIDAYEAKRQKISN